MKAYLTHDNYLELSRSVANPGPTSMLSKQIVKGLANSRRSPLEAALKKTRRPLTPAMIKLLGHALVKITVIMKNHYAGLLFWLLSGVASELESFLANRKRSLILFQH